MNVSGHGFSILFTKAVEFYIYHILSLKELIRLKKNNPFKVFKELESIFELKDFIIIRLWYHVFVMSPLANGVGGLKSCLDLVKERFCDRSNKTIKFRIIS